ncbi:UDP-N-acetylmuramate--L-alanine ligase [Prochlorococcus sp. AH-736-E15]|nr:UDP-N-acetylmuramate--L-alanine ligase [Prochlorococcus sp. AH-736-E15]
MNKELLLKSHFHFIGIGGIGMSAIAIGLLKKGYSVSGSDLIKNNEINKLKKLGAVIFNSQTRQNIEFVISKFNNRLINFVVSSAIKPENEEFSYCREKNLKIKHRSEMLAMLMENYTTLGVAGSHGKTSTSTFLSTLLELCTHNSSSIIGGIIPIYNSNCHLENTKFLVAEVDESDGTINRYRCDIGIINNIDFDHCDHFSNLNEVISSFKAFAARSKKLLLNFDCETTRNNFDSSNKWSNVTTKDVAYSIIPSEINESHTIGKYYENGNFISNLNIPIPGLHNLSNITAAIAASRMIGVNFFKIEQNIKYLQLPKKRFELRGQIDERNIYDDYAHHPNEIKETIKLARLFMNQKNNNLYKGRLIAIFQPHRYSRAKQFTKEFAEELSKADIIYVTNIYGAGEEKKDTISSKIITDLIYKFNKNVKYINNYQKIAKNFFELTQKGDLILNMGAGDCHNFWSILNEKYNYGNKLNYE